MCLYVPGFQRQVLKNVPNSRWIPQTKFQWIPHTYTCNVNFVGTFVLLQNPQQAKIASCSGFRNNKWIPQNVSRIRKCKWNPQILHAESANVSGFRNLLKDFAFLFITELGYEQLKDRGGIFDLLSIGTQKNLSICQRNPQTKLKKFVNYADVKSFVLI